MDLCLLLLTPKKESARNTIPTGFIVIHPTTKNPLGIGTSPLSDLLLKTYNQGVEFVVPHFIDKKSITVSPKELKDLSKLADYFDLADLRLVQRNLLPPLHGLLGIDTNFNPVPLEGAYETLEVRSSNV